MSDLKRTFRFIRTHPTFACLVILCLGLGIGLNSAIFSVVDRVLFRPLPYQDPERIVMIEPFNGENKTDASYRNFLAWREQNRVFEGIEARRGEVFYNLTGTGEPERVAAGEMSPGLLTLLGVKPVLGRVTFLPEEIRTGGTPVAVLGHDLWLRRFEGSPSVLGSSISLSGKSYTIIGVLPAGFYFFRDADLWLPMPIDAANPPFPPTIKYLVTTGRLKPGVTLAQARASMHLISQRLAQEYPETNTGWDVDLIPLREELVGDLRGQLRVLIVAVAFVLLIACANVGNLFLSRAASQRDEMALRTALGASRLRIARQILTESVILAFLGGVLGLALAAVAIRLLPHISNVVGALLHEGVALDLRVLGFTLAISLLTGLLPGLLVALNTARPELSNGLKSGSRRSTTSGGGHRLQSGLVIAEVALALVLLVSAGLMIESFLRLRQTSPGFEPKNVLTAQVSLTPSKYKDPAQMRHFWRDLLPRLSALPGVVAVGITHAIPLNEDTYVAYFMAENQGTSAAATEMRVANFRKVTPGFFPAMKIPLLRGRLLNDQDDESKPVAIDVSQEMARRLWPDTDPMGKRIHQRAKPWMTVVGVVGDVQDELPGTKIGSTYYMPYVQDPASANATLHVMVRTEGDPRAMVAAVRHEFLSVDPGQPIDRVMTMEDRLSGSLAKSRFSTLLLGLFAGLGIVLATIGIYGVLSYAVSRRHHEIGIRMALGARARDVTQLILRQGMKLTGIGLAIGLGVTLAVSRLLQSLLYQVRATDPATFLGITLALAGVAGLASYVPARRAARVDPIRTLKQD